MAMKNETLFQQEYWIIDILPKQVPQQSGGQFFEIEKIWQTEPHMAGIKRKHLEMILKLNCYRSLSTDEGQTVNPSPAEIAAAVLKKHTVFRIDDALLVSEPDETYMTLYHPDDDLLELVNRLSSGEGLYLWKPEQLII